MAQKPDTMVLKALVAQNKLLRTAMVQIVNDPEMAVKWAVQAIRDCELIESWQKKGKER